MNTIELTIPVQEFSAAKYASDDCYLKEALEKLGYKDVYVTGFGFTKIGELKYRPVYYYTRVLYMTELFGNYLRDELTAGREVKVALRRSNWNF